MQQWLKRIAPVNSKKEKKIFGVHLAHTLTGLFFCTGYYEALKKFTLKKFLLLILFLDKAKLTRLIDHDPCLFNKEAEFKVFKIHSSVFRSYLFKFFSITHSKVSGLS